MADDRKKSLDQSDADYSVNQTRNYLLKICRRSAGEQPGSYPGQSAFLSDPFGRAADQFRPFKILFIAFENDTNTPHVFMPYYSMGTGIRYIIG